jgi:hypothetical protein
MSTQPYRDNDDDLFDYDPTKDKSPLVENNFSNSSSVHSSSNEVLDDMYRNIEKASTNFDDQSIKFRVGLADSLYGAYNTFISKSQVISHMSSTVEILDELTAGKYSALYTCRHIEQNIFRRLGVHILVSAVIENDITDVDGVSFQDFLRKMNINIPDDFVTTYFSTLLRISNHILNVERSIYIALCNKLGVVPDSRALDPEVGPKEVNSAVPMSATDFRERQIDKAISSMYDESFVQSINSIFVTDASPRIVDL